MRKFFRFSLILALLIVAGAVWAGSIQGPVRGVVETEDGAELDDVVVRMTCRGYLFHGSHTTDVETRVVSTGEGFLFPWAYRGLFPASCSLYVYHPQYYFAYRNLGDEFSHDVGTIILQTWDAFLDAGPTDPPAHSAYPWPMLEWQQHLSHLDYYFLTAFKPSEYAGLSAYVPHLHHLFRRVIATGAYGGNERHSRNSPMHRVRDIEDKLGFPGAQTLLFEAVKNDDPVRVQEVIDAGVWLDAWDVKGYSALNQAVRDNKPKAAKVLLEAGADPEGRIQAKSRSLLDKAIRERHLEIVALLLKHGAVLDRGEVKPDDLSGALRGTVWEKDPATLRVLLAAGVEPDISSSNGYTALMDAAKQNELEIAQILIAAGADVNACASHNRYPLRLAKGNRKVDTTEMVALLQQAGAKDLGREVCEPTPPELHRIWWERENAKRVRNQR